MFRNFQFLVLIALMAFASVTNAYGYEQPAYGGGGSYGGSYGAQAMTGGQDFTSLLKAIFGTIFVIVIIVVVLLICSSVIGSATTSFEYLSRHFSSCSKGKRHERHCD